jgi:hypothetical protein
MEKITNILLTKESMSTYIYELRKTEAAKYGLTPEEYLKAVSEGTTINPLSTAKDGEFLPLV